jgi:hypothetical protein
MDGMLIAKISSGFPDEILILLGSSEAITHNITGSQGVENENNKPEIAVFVKRFLAKRLTDKYNLKIKIPQKTKISQSKELVMLHESMPQLSK